ncbi:MAG: hypothetical protein SGCHY_004219, partial [Lobulomycetales sp.]
RAVRIAVEALQNAGHEVVEFEPPNVERMIQIFFRLVGADACQTVVDSLNGDKREAGVRQLLAVYSVPNWVKALVSRILRMIGQNAAAGLLASSRGSTVHELWQLQHERSGLNAEFLDKLHAERFDFVIAPANAHPAIPHGSFGDISFAACYTMLYNVLDYTVGSLPVCTVDKDLDKLTGWPEKGSENYMIHALKTGKSLLDAAVSMHYDASKAHGLPVGVQVVTGKFKEEETLEYMRILEDAIQK